MPARPTWHRQWGGLHALGLTLGVRWGEEMPEWRWAAALRTHPPLTCFHGFFRESVGLVDLSKVAFKPSSQPGGCGFSGPQKGTHLVGMCFLSPVSYLFL